VSTGEASRRVAALWSVILGPPLVWAVRIALSYVLVPPVCQAGAVWVLHVLTAVSLAACAAFGRLALRLQPEPEPAAPGWRGDDEALRQGRTLFMARVGVFSSALFALVIVAEGLANLFLDPCLRAGPLLP